MPTATANSNTPAGLDAGISEFFDLDLRVEFDPAGSGEQSVLTGIINCGTVTAITCGWTCTGTTTSPCAC